MGHIYNDGFPDFLAELLEAEELQRLKRWNALRMNTVPSPVPVFLALYEMDSQRGAGLIVWHFTFDVKQSIADCFMILPHRFLPMWLIL